ncbi:MAG: c-type cytochrome domain-containing protein [Bryobacterales bacterium]
MNVEPAPGDRFNALAFSVTQDRLAKLDQRERYYKRASAPLLDFDSGESLGEGHFYMGEDGSPFLERNPDLLMPLWRDIVWARAGCLSHRRALRPDVRRHHLPRRRPNPHDRRLPRPAARHQRRRNALPSGGVQSGAADASASRRLRPAEPARLAASARRRSPPFHEQVQPLLDKYCVSCHGPAVQLSGFRADNLPADIAATRRNTELWARVLGKLRRGDMPPPAAPQPEAAQRDQPSPCCAPSSTACSTSAAAPTRAPSCAASIAPNTKTP